MIRTRFSLRFDPAGGESPERFRKVRTRREATVRVALLSYRSKPHCGGQGIYIRHLSRELVALGRRERGDHRGELLCLGLLTLGARRLDSRQRPLPQAVGVDQIDVDAVGRDQGAGPGRAELDEGAAVCEPRPVDVEHPDLTS